MLPCCRCLGDILHKECLFLAFFAAKHVAKIHVKYVKKTHGIKYPPSKKDVKMSF